MTCVDERKQAARPATGAPSEPAFMRVTAPQIGRVVARSSPHFQEGAWTAREYALWAAVVTLWFTDLQQVAREQIKSDGGLRLNGTARRLLDTERIGVEAVAAWLGLEPVWIDRMLQSLGLVFPVAPELELAESGSETSAA